jgi:hypothetical protein
MDAGDVQDDLSVDEVPGEVGDITAWVVRDVAR